MLPVTGESCRTGLQLLHAETLLRGPRLALGTGFKLVAEIFHKLLRLHTPQPLVGIAHDFVAARGQDVGGQPVAATGHQTRIGLQVDVVAAMQRLLAARRDVCPHVVLVGRLVGREARVAIEPVGTVLHLQMSQRVVKAHIVLQRLCHTVFKLHLGGFVCSLVLLKPGAVVVHRHLSQEI